MLNMGLEFGFRSFSVLLQDVELAVTLLYQLGEGAAEETLKPGSGALGQLATGKAAIPDITTACYSIESVMSCALT